MPIPSQLQGCSIIVCDKHSGKPIDTTPFNQITYQPGPFLTGYNAGNFYRLYVDLLYQDDTMPVPAIMAIMYQGPSDTLGLMSYRSYPPIFRTLHP